MAKKSLIINSLWIFPAYSLRILFLATALRFTKSAIDLFSEIRFFHLLVFKQGGGLVG